MEGCGPVYPVPAELQLHQLALSMNQVYQVLWALQRDLATLSDRVGAIESTTARHGASSSQISPPSPPDVWNSG